MQSVNNVAFQSAHSFCNHVTAGFCVNLKHIYVREHQNVDSHQLGDLSQGLSCHWFFFSFLILINHAGFPCMTT
jgi:hypothetical protein